MDAGIKVPSTDILQFLKVLPLRPKICKGIASPASSTARIPDFVLSASLNGSFELRVICIVTVSDMYRNSE